MQNKHTTEINIYHTPDKTSKPDHLYQSHLKTTVPSGLQTSQTKSPNQYGTHHSKMKGYSFDEPTQQYSQKRPTKNQWELKERVEEYEGQIRLLEEYLKGVPSSNLEKNSIQRIFGFPDSRDRLQRQQQNVIKQLGSKVKSLIKQNTALKYKNSNYGQLSMEEIIQQNNKLQNLLQQYKVNDSINHTHLVQQNEQLKDQLHKLRIQYEQNIKLIELQNQRKINHLRANEHELIAKLQLNEKQHETNFKSYQLEQEKLTHLKVKQIEEIYSKQLKQSQIFWKKKMDDQEQYYAKIKNEWESVNKEISLRLQNQELKRLKQYYLDVIQDIEAEQKIKFQKLVKDVMETEKKIDKLNQSISHLKFERQNRMMQTSLRKSKNVATLSPKPRGEDVDQKIIPDDNEQNAKINTQPLSKSITPRKKQITLGLQLPKDSARSQISSQKVTYLERQLKNLKQKLNLSQRIVGDKNDKIISLQNQILKLNSTIHNLNLSLSEINYSAVKQVARDVPSQTMANKYVEEVRSIKQTIKSCNMSNFDIFETEFNQIVNQRNQMSEKLMTLKKQAKQSSKLLVLEKHLKVERQKNKILQENIKRYEKEMQHLKIQIIQLQSQMESINSKLVWETSLQNNRKDQNILADGKAGLQWQKIVKHCLMTSIKRLQNLEGKIKQDLDKQSRGQ